MGDCIIKGASAVFFFPKQQSVRGGSGGQGHKNTGSSGISAMAWLNMSAVANRSQRNPKRKRHTELKNENVERGCARADSEGIKNVSQKSK